MHKSDLLPSTEPLFWNPSEETDRSGFSQGPITFCWAECENISRKIGYFYFGVAAIFVIKQISGEVMMIVMNMTDIEVRHGCYQYSNRVEEGSSHHLRPFLPSNSADIYTAAAVLAG
jgi:hypothetical protein